MTWWHPFICSLPESLRDVLEAPVPIMVGIDREMVQENIPCNAIKVWVTMGQDIKVENA